MFDSGERKFLYQDECDNLSSIGWTVGVCGDKDWIQAALSISSYGKQVTLDFSHFGRSAVAELEVLDTIIEQLIKMRTNYNEALKILEGTD